ncbi:MAG: dicarboxylate/amino acid:cation symporter [Bacilli bacterium]|jgi:Na+/H+-dicarboxylate symporter|nr:dicarboxylate/amino acid:cation symporter [Bacilli bacterium]
MKKLKPFIFPLILIGSVLIGSLIGVIFKEDATVLKPFGEVFLNLMYTLVVPLVFFTISSSIANMVNMKRLGHILKYLFITFLFTSFVAAVLMLIVSLIIDPVGGASIPFVSEGQEAVNIGSKIVEMITVTDFASLLSKDHMLPLIIFSIIFGISISLLGKEGKKIATGLETLSKVMMKFIRIIMYYAPIGLGAYFASLVGEFGPNLLGSYARSMALYYGMCILYFFIMYTIYSYFSHKKKGIKAFYKNAFAPALTSLATQSSLASLPSNLEAAEHMGVPKDVREICMPIGATMHMEGSSMAAILKIVFLFGIFGVPFTGIDTYLIALLIAVLSGVVMSGIPGGGLIGEMLIVSLYNFPASAFPIIATIAWLVDPPATCLNVTGDITSSMLVTRMVDGKDWIKD